MALSNKPKKSKYQVGDTVFFLSNGKGTQAQIIKVSSSVSNPDNDANGIQENIYYMEGFVKGFAETELFHSMNALMFNVKGDYLNNWNNTTYYSNFFNFNLDLTYSDFSGCDFAAADPLDLNEAIFDGCNFSNSGFGGCDLSNCSFKYAKFKDTYINSADFRGADLTGCDLPLSANTKSSFKSVVGDGHWDPETTIWIDGNPIG